MVVIVIIMLSSYFYMWVFILTLPTPVVSWGRVWSVPHYFVRKTRLPLASAHNRLVQSRLPETNDDDNKRKGALELLDCLTSPKDQDDPQYDVGKDIRRDNLLLANDYSDLKTALKQEGLRTSGDKLEMITRLLLHIVDPSIKYEEISGIGVNLKYIDTEDIASKKVRVRSEEERSTDSLDNIDPDADDLIVLKGRRRTAGDAIRVPYSANNVVDDPANNPHLVMDGLTRKEVVFTPLQVRRSEVQTRKEDYTQSTAGKTPILLPAYVVASKDVLKRWTHTATAVVLLPDGGASSSWQSKAVRIMADELAFAAQAVVIVPDIYRGSSFSVTDTTEQDANDLPSAQAWRESLHNHTIFDDIVAATHFVRTEYGARSVSLAGVGFGAGRALEAACDLHDLGRLAQCREIEDGSRHLSSKRSSLLAHQAGHIRQARQEEEEEGVNGRNLLKLALEDRNGTLYNTLQSALGKYRNVFIKPVLAPTAAITQEEVFQDRQDNASLDPLSSTHFTESPGGDVAPTFDVNAAVVKSVSDILSTTEPFQQLSDLFDRMGGATGAADNATGAGTRETLSSSDPGVELALDAILEKHRKEEFFSTPGGDVRKIVAAVREESAEDLDHRATVSEVQTMLAASQRAEMRKLLAPYGALNMQEIIDYVPRSVLAYAPEWFDAERVGRELCTPAFLAFSGAQHAQSTAASLYAQLAARLDEVGDVCFRTYRGTSVDFTHTPVTELDSKCSQEAVAMGGLWADAFSAQDSDADELPEGLGENKLTDGAFCEVSPEEMTSPPRPSALATYLHDDPIWLRNNRLIY